METTLTASLVGLFILWLILLIQQSYGRLTHEFLLYILPIFVAYSVFLKVKQTDIKVLSKLLLGLFLTLTMLVFANRGLFSAGPVLGLGTIIISAVLFPIRFLIWIVLFLVSSVWAASLVSIYSPSFLNLNTRLSETNLLWSRACAITAVYITFAIGLRQFVIKLSQDATNFVSLEQHAFQKEIEIINLLEFANAPIFRVDQQGIIDQWNHSMEIILGVDRVNALGKNLVENFATRDSKQALTKVIEDTLKGLESHSFQTALTTQSAPRIELLINTSCQRNIEGDVLGVLCVGQDVTSMRQKEEMLVRAQKLDSIGQLTGGIAHDFNNLLTVIQGNLELLKERVRGLGSDNEEIITDVHEACVRGAGLISQLLAFAGKRTLIPQEIDINELITESSRMIVRTLGSSITVSMQLSEKSLFAAVDTSLLESSLINLSINARDAMNDGKGVIELSSYQKEINSEQANLLQIDAGEYVFISVKDNGNGITPDNLIRVIDPFFSTKNQTEASGLGLSMVHGFTKQSKGALDIQSELGVGTTVTMILPALSGHTIVSE